ncbi:uncharacterized protein GGS25DRAFT_524826 [Hypoxylon fragiforme]|uniref:uncharacterized protein n=1 Tax=Hypoxylon fragiforme TaxID=63214 RepID=UPI0020C5CD20|nr:uncharacterized protein GGS25DRAFT_524826 [Hypoxylon fragiforme]KAI2605308.1 hypothetical protein GGS25DRAFT_524826 [Hypoxylon fragiforme]
MKTTSALSLGFAVATRFCSAAEVTTPTIIVPVPTQGAAFTSTVSACDTVPAFAIIGVPNGTFFPGTTTIYLPPQASEATSTFVDLENNLTEVVIASPLPGSCADISLPADATGTVNPSPSSSAEACPLKGCSAGVDKSAQLVINLINEVAIASQELQAAAKKIGTRKARGLEPRLNILTDIVPPLQNIVATLTLGLPTIAVLSPFPPGCDSDTIVVALIDFVRIHQALLEVFIGRAGLLSGPFLLAERAAIGGAGVGSNEKFFNPLGIAIAGALRAIETVVDNLAFAIIGLVPTRQACLNQQKISIDGTLKEAIKAYQP